MLSDLRDRLLRPLMRPPLTARHPAVPPMPPPGARGLPVADPGRCDGRAACVGACPTGAIAVDGNEWRLDLGRCVFCAACADACPGGAIALTGRVELAARERASLVVVSRVEGGS